jgi:hypothetical protein
LSCAGLTRASIFLQRNLVKTQEDYREESDGPAGQARG